MNDKEKKEKRIKIILFSIVIVLIVATIVQSIVLVSLKSKLDKAQNDYESIKPLPEENDAFCDFK